MRFQVCTPFFILCICFQVVVSSVAFFDMAWHPGPSQIAFLDAYPEQGIEICRLQDRPDELMAGCAGMSEA